MLQSKRLTDKVSYRLPNELTLTTVWFGMVAAFFLWNLHELNTHNRETLINSLNTSFTKDEALRKWFSKHDGIYVETARAEGNNTVRLADGRYLKKKNPIAILREYYDESSSMTGMVGDIFTDLTPLNQENMANQAQEALMQRFRGGEDKVVVEQQVARKITMARPILSQPRCLRCHNDYGLSEHDFTPTVVGGFSLEMKYGENSSTNGEIRVLLFEHVMIALLGLLGIIVSTRKLRASRAEESEAKAELMESEQLMSAVIGSSMDAIITVDRFGCIKKWEGQAEKVFGWSQREVEGQHAATLISTGRLEETTQQNELWRNTIKLDRVLFSTLKRKGEEAFYAEVLVKRISYGGKMDYCYFIEDITQRRAKEEKGKRDLFSQKVIASILELSSSPISFKEKIEKALGAILSTPWLSIQSKGGVFLAKDGQLELFAHKGLSETVQTACEKVAFGNCLCGRAAETKKMVFAAHVDDRHDIRPSGMQAHGHYCVPIVYDGGLKGVLVLYVRDGHEEDDDERNFLKSVCNALGNIIHSQHMQQELEFGAYYDSLTGLPNRKLLSQRVNACINKYKRDKQRKYAVLFVDLNRFKAINDSLGHAAGDAVLNAVSDRIGVELRNTDTVARLGGDEFVVLLEEVNGFESVYRIVDRIHDSVNAVIDIGMNEVYTSASIGIAFCDRDYGSFEEVIRDADIAMYRAKGFGPSSTVVFDEKMYEEALSGLYMENNLRQALDRGELEVHYQPVFSLIEKRFVGAEALVRWPTEEGFISPAEFIPVAEETGLINDVGRFVAESVCELLSTRPVPDDFYITVNISAKQILHSSVVELIDEVLTRHSLSTHRIRLEITESVFAGDMDVVENQLNGLKQRGIKLLVDDFGTGYSSLSFLHRFPFDALKVDQSFVRNLLESEESASMVRTIVDLARSLDIDVVVEGVETDRQIDYLTSLGCDLIQGYYFSRPLPEEAFLEKISSPETAAALS